MWIHPAESVVCGEGSRHASCAPPPALSARHMTRHNQPARAAAARTFLASLGARGGAHLDTQFSRRSDPARYAKSSPRVR